MSDNPQQFGRGSAAEPNPNHGAPSGRALPRSNASEAVLTARALRKTYLSGDRQIEVLGGVDLSVAAGESVSIRGESGSGKSTLLNLLSALDAPDSGEVIWDGKPSIGT